jgi:hypothetical protein
LQYAATAGEALRFPELSANPATARLASYFIAGVTIALDIRHRILPGFGNRWHAAVSRGQHLSHSVMSKSVRWHTFIRMIGQQTFD